MSLSLGIEHTAFRSFFLILAASKNKLGDSVFAPLLIENNQSILHMLPKSNPPSQDCQVASGRHQPVMEPFQKSPSHEPKIMQGQNPHSGEMLGVLQGPE